MQAPVSPFHAGDNSIGTSNTVRGEKSNNFLWGEVAASSHAAQDFVDGVERLRYKLVGRSCFRLRSPNGELDLRSTRTSCKTQRASQEDALANVKPLHSDKRVEVDIQVSRAQGSCMLEEEWPYSVNDVVQTIIGCESKLGLIEDEN